MAKCLTSEQIRRYAAGRCSGEELKEIAAHLAECETCRWKAEELRSGAGRDSAEQEDESRTKSMPEVSVFQTRGDEVAVALETMTDGYTILGMMPRGGQALVYRAIQKSTRRMVAVKVLLQGQHASRRAQFRFTQEIELVARLKHPNIVTIFDSGIAQGQYYYAMEYIRGVPLDEYAAKNKLSPRKIMELFGKVASAVACAHQHGIMHRDLKGGNILVDEQGEPHVLDFGLAKVADGFEQSYEKTVMTSIDGQVMGTLAFMSPEQATAKPEAIDIRTDVYSLGVILYLVLTGEFPYPISGPMFEILQNIKLLDPVKPSKLITWLDSEVEAIVLRCLAKEPERRYQSASELGHDIDCWLTNRPIAARSDSSFYVIRKLILRNRYAVAVIGLLVVIISAFSFSGFYLYGWAKDGWDTTVIQKRELQERLDQTRKQGLSHSFHVFLDSWRQDLIDPAHPMATLKNDERYDAAQTFLLDTGPFADKTATFRNRIGKEHLWFVDFILGEYYIKQNQKKDALDAFERSCKNLGSLGPEASQAEDWIVSRITSRLTQLQGARDEG